MYFAVKPVPKSSHPVDKSRAGWIKILSNPEVYNNEEIVIRGIFTHKAGAGTGIEIWMTDWAMHHGQLEFYLHVDQDSVRAFFGENHSAKAEELEGKTVEVQGVFIASSRETNKPAIGNIKNIMICDLDTPAKAGPLMDKAK